MPFNYRHKYCFGLLLLDELRKRRKEIKKFSKKLEDTLSSIQGIELNVELMEQGYKELNNSLKHLKEI